MRTQLPYFPSLAWLETKPQRVSALEKQLPHSTTADTFMGKQALSTKAIPHSPVTTEFLQEENTGTLRFGTALWNKSPQAQISPIYSFIRRF
jgi:hypothetical protein